MTLLSMAFREQVKQTKDIAMTSEMTYGVSYPTGFLNMDFANGYIQEINGKMKFELGISDGSMNMIISDSGVGKTTIATQIASNIIKPFQTSCIFYEQAEATGTNIQRLKNLTGMDDETFEKRFIVRDAGITTESIYNRAKMVYNIKVNNPDNYMYDTGMVDIHGKPIYKFEPTVMIIDSVKLVLSEKISQATETTNMTGAQNAKTNSEYYSKMLPLCKMANIIVFFINHITVDVNTGFLPKKAELAYLKQGEHIAGGRSLTYIQNNIFRLDIKSKLKPEEGLGISGSTVSLDVVKSRTNTSSRGKCTLVFDQATGYDNDLSLFMMLKDRKLLEGSGAFLKLPGYDKKFSQKKFKEELYSDPEFFNAFVSICITTLKNDLLEEYQRIKKENSLSDNSKSPYEAMLEQLSVA